MQTEIQSQSTQSAGTVAAFPLLPVEELQGMHAVAGDDVANAAAAVTKPMPASCPMNRLAHLHDRALRTLESDREPQTPAPAPASKSDADAYDEYFAVIRARGNNRRIFAVGTLTAFRDLFIDMESGTQLDAVGISSVRTAEYELLRLVAPDEDLYY